MAFKQDPRVRIARRALVLSWSFFTVYVGVMLLVALGLGSEPLLFGLPRWAAWSCLIVPAAFVAVLVPIVERSIPDIPLSDDAGEDPR